jgi:hypothetical protein
VLVEDLADQRLERVEQRRPELALRAHERSLSIARSTVSWCAPSSVAIVATFQCSAKNSRRIALLRGH